MNADAGSPGPAAGGTVPAGRMPPWRLGELPRPPRIRWTPAALVGPGLMLAGAAIGGGEWLMGPAVTAKFGGVIMWLATASIFFQVIYNIEVTRYALYCGEPIFVGFFRLPPGPRFWTLLYIFIDFFGIWPYLSANAAVPLNAAFLGHLPGAYPTRYLTDEEVIERTGLPPEVVLELRDHPERFGSEDGKKPVPEPIARQIDGEKRGTQWLSYLVFALSFTPLFFGGKIYNSLEKLMVTKIILVLGYLVFLGIFYVSAGTWLEVFAGFAFLGQDAAGGWGFRLLPELPADAPPIDWALLGAFAAIAGQGGMTNSQTSNYARDKGWGMGSHVGAIPSIVGGKQISLSHTGMVFPVGGESLPRWRGWMRFLLRDQIVIWGFGCILGVGIPALVSLQFVRGIQLDGNEVAAATALGIVHRTGIQAFWFLTLLCGFIVLGTSQVSQIDGVIRRWTDVIWTGSPRVRHLEGHKVKYIYYGLVAIFGAWGIFVLTWLRDQPLLLVKVTGVLMNFALGFSSFQALAVNSILLPRELRPGWIQRLGLAACGIFFIAISLLGLAPALRGLGFLE